MDILDLNFKEVLQKPIELTFFARHFQGQLSNQELKTVVGGSKPVNIMVQVSESALSAKEIIADAGAKRGSWRWCKPDEKPPGNHPPDCYPKPGQHGAGQHVVYIEYSVTEN